MSFEFPLRVYWEDTDAGGIVFYANYLKFMERARTEWLRSLGIEQRQLRVQTGGMFVVSEVQLRYHRPAQLDDRLVVSAMLAEQRAASLIIAQRVGMQSASQAAASPDKSIGVNAGGGNPASGDLLCEGTVRIGWVDATTLRPARIPSHVFEALTHPGRAKSQPLQP